MGYNLHMLLITYVNKIVKAGLRVFEPVIIIKYLSWRRALLDLWHNCSNEKLRMQINYCPVSNRAVSLNKITPKDSTLFVHLREIAARGAQELISAGFFDPVKEGPKVEIIEGMVKPFLERGRHTNLPNEKLGWIIDQEALQVGTAFQGLGNLDIALLWYQVGQYGWRGGAHWYEGNLFDLDWDERESPALGQEDSAICAALVNNTHRARQLFEWIAQNRKKTDLEIQVYEEARSYNDIWESLGFQIFCLMWLDNQWPEVSRLSEIGKRAIEKTRKAGYPKDFRVPQLLVDIGWHMYEFLHLTCIFS